MIGVLILALMIMVFPGIQTVQAEVVIPDPGLEKILRSALAIDETEAITETGLALLTVVDGDTENIVDLRGLEYCTGLLYLMLPNNHIVDISPIKGLTTLNALVLDNNHVSDITPLQGLNALVGLSLDKNCITDLSVVSGLVSLEVFNVNLNPLSVTAINEQLPQLPPGAVLVEGFPERPSFTTYSDDNCTIHEGENAGEDIYSGGMGTENDPYQIETIADWTALMETETHWDKHFLLIGDIDFAGASLTPIGTQSVPFSGTFDGSNHKVSNGVLYIFSNDGGLFGYMGSSGVIRNVGVRKVAVLSGSDCYYVGGLLGYNGGGKITLCYATGEVTGDAYVGGLVGWNDTGGTVTSCYSTGAVTGSSYVGGFAGTNGGIITSCYSTGAVTGSYRYAGGLAGNNYGIITSCYSTGTVTGSYRVGGLVGEISGTVTSCYWNIDTSGIESSGGGVGCVTDEMTYPYAANAFFNWDFVKTWAADTDYNLNNGYPYLRGNEPTQETLAVTPIHHEVEASKGSTTSAVKTTALWAVTSDSDWAKVNPISGTGNGTITISYEANVGKERSATISVTGVDTNPRLVIVKVKQAVGIEGEGEAPAEGEGEVPVEGEGETAGEGEATGEGESLEGETPGEGEVPDDSSCGCNGKTWVAPKDRLGDWLLIGLTLMVLAGTCFRRNL